VTTKNRAGDDLFIQLLEYYKMIDKEAVLFYWNEYDGKEKLKQRSIGVYSPIT